MKYKKDGSPIRHQAIIETNDGVWTLENKVQWTLNEYTTIVIQKNEKFVWKWWPFCFDGNVLNQLCCAGNGKPTMTRVQSNVCVQMTIENFLVA